MSRSSRGQREEDPSSSSQAPCELAEFVRTASGQSERAQSGKPGLLRRFKDVLKRPSSSGSARMERQESRMDRQESVLLTNGSGGAFSEPAPPHSGVHREDPQPPQQQPERAPHAPPSRSHLHHHRSSRHRGHVRHEEPPQAAVDPDQRSEGGRRRHGRRRRRHSSRGRPNAREHQSRRKTDGAATAQASPLVMPWEGDPFWQVCALPLHQP